MVRAPNAIAAIAAAVALSACAVGPNYHRPSAPVPSAYKELPPGWKVGTPSDERDREERGVGLRDHLVAEAVPQPLGGLGIELLEQHGTARGHGPVAGGVVAEDQHLAGAEQAVDDFGGLAVQPGDEPTHDRGPGRVGAKLVGGQEPLGDEDGGRVGEGGHRDVSGLAGRLVDVKRGPDKGGGLGQQAVLGRFRQGTPGDDEHSGHWGGRSVRSGLRLVRS